MDRSEFTSAVGDTLTQGTLRMDLDSGRIGAQWPITSLNSGSAGRSASLRGDWLYIPTTAPLDLLRENRKQRGLVKEPDTAKEVSLTCPIPPDLLESLRQ